MNTTQYKQHTQRAIVVTLLVSATAHAVPTLQIITPTAGQALKAGTSVQIVWNCTQPSGYADIYLDKGGTPYAAIASVPLTDGKATWEICPAIGNGTDYRIRIVRPDNAGGKLEISSNLFTIRGSLTVPEITITAPAAGAALTNGVSTPITWTSINPSGCVYIDLLKNGVLYRTIGYASVSAGLFNWNASVPDATDYSIRISMDGCGPVPDAYSGIFAVQGSPAGPPTIGITRPAGGETWSAGTTEAVDYTATGTNKAVRVDLMKAGKWHAYLGTAFSSPFNWTIGANVGNGEDYTIRMTLYDAVVAESPAFAITGASALPAVQFTSPSDGEIWTINYPWSLTWQSTGTTGPVTLWLVKGGDVYSCFGSVDAAAGAYTCNVFPGLPPCVDNQFLISTVGPGPLATDVSGLDTTGDAPLVGTFAINQGITGTKNPMVTLNNSYVELPTAYMASESLSFSDAGWQPYSTAPSFTLSEGYGMKTVYFKVRNAFGESSVVTDMISLDPCYTPRMDANGDLHVDGVDYGVFSDCYNGPTNKVGGDCLCMDANGDQYVDAIDFDAFSACDNGPVNPPGCQ